MPLPLNSTGEGWPPRNRFNANLTIGAIEIGVLVSTFLFGLVTVQCYIYIHRFPKDPAFLKALSGIIAPFISSTSNCPLTCRLQHRLLELAHTICICQALYEITVSQYGHPELLDIPPESLNVAVLFSGFIGPIEQCWFAHRLYKFSRSLPLPLFCTSLALLRWIGSVGISIVALHRLTVEMYFAHWSWLLTAILVVGAGTDVILAAGLCWYLRKWRGSGFKRTSRLVDRLMIWSIETGLLTSLNARPALAQIPTQDEFIRTSTFRPEISPVTVRTPMLLPSTACEGRLKSKPPN
ncbi:hypothetical protein JR316_0000233 [Psilocybe cubensis]|uniref:Uncharacterized protein n=2 Tax=Psilocybe cubensis TaxID=181762 RepID=A0ACB8HG75_PSICU|nr:hypothetical protein JR316_0000233 [Psilocybe cubensis]KAH9486169.1 hypothetical protein JR316_0000233 [Psilocybe cubensis]